MSTQTDTIRKALTLVVNKQKPLITQGEDYIWRPAKACFDAANEALAALSELEVQPSAPTVDIHAIAEDLTAHLAKMSLPTDPHGWKVIVRIALILRLTKLLNP